MTSASDDSPATPPTISVRENGPFVAKAIPRLTVAGQDTDPVKPVMALCRCGGSGNKPFCDGSHNTNGFDGTPSEERPRDRLLSYEGEELTVYFNPRVCCHSGECGRRLETVFDAKRRPWIEPDNAGAEEIRAVIAACPSGALTCSAPGGTPEQLTSEPDGITVEPDGPYRVTGIALEGTEFGAGASARKYALCRCGASKNKPFCDGSHARIGWKG